MDITKKLAIVEQELAEVNSAEAFQEVLKHHGVELTLEEIRELEMQAAAEQELEESALDNVAGGSVPVNPFVALLMWWLNRKRK
jgi:hypothetical protein